MDPKEIVREIKNTKITNFNIEADGSITTYNPNRTITCLVKKYAHYVGDSETAKYFSSDGDYPEVHMQRAIERIGDLAEFEGYNFLEVVHSE